MQFITKRTAPPLRISERCPKMMIGEPTRPHPTVKIPAWDPFNDPTSNFPSVSYNCNAPSTPFPVDYLASLHRFLPSNDFEFDSLSEDSDLPVDAFSCDHFRMYEFKVRRCSRGRSHDWTECPYAHPGEKARRRDPKKFHYSGTACPDFRKGNCRKGDSCEFAHGVFECWLHPARYRTQPCKDGTSCTRRVCFFAHTPEQLRVLPQQSPRGNASGSVDLDYFGSPVRHRLDFASPTSILASPPISPPSYSPPMSPSGSFNSVSELADSMRNLQLRKAKMSGACSWGLQMGSGFGSPRGSTLRPGFCSSPKTPTLTPTRSGVGQLDLWECNAFEEEPAMERVESGRDLRARMYAKLSKENSLDQLAPTGSGPDFGWVSELVK